jgi:hypothetical protein
MAGQTRDIMDRGVLLDPLHHLGVGTVTSAAQDQQSVGPGCAQTLAHAFQPCEHLWACETLRLEDGRHQASQEALIQVERHKTIATIIAIVAGVFLLAMDTVLGVIDIEHDDLGGLVIGGALLLQQHQHHAGEFGACDVVFKAR